MNISDTFGRFPPIRFGVPWINGSKLLISVFCPLLYTLTSSSQLRPHQECEAEPLVPCGESARIVRAWCFAFERGDGMPPPAMRCPLKVESGVTMAPGHHGDPSKASKDVLP